MKKRFTTVAFVFTLAVSLAYGQTVTPTFAQQQFTQKNEDSVFQLFPTQNTWTFIKLNTRNGKMWQLQWNTKEDLRQVTNLNPLSLIPLESEKNGRFTLCATVNMYNFILIDQISGNTWQVQWSTIPENRLVIPIE